MFDIDVHVIHMPNASRRFFAECINSLRNEPINLHVLEGVEGDIGRARYEGFRKGNAPYVAFVDDDDFIVPGIFEKIAECLKVHPVVYTDELLVDAEGNLIMPGFSIDPKPFVDFPALEQCRIPGTDDYCHHILAFRRDLLHEVRDSLLTTGENACEPALIAELAKRAKFHHLKEVGYFWRIHERNWSRRFREEV